MWLPSVNKPAPSSMIFVTDPANLDDDNKKETLIETAAKLLKEDIKLVETNHDLYPDLSATEVQEYLNFITYAI